MKRLILLAAIIAAASLPALAGDVKENYTQLCAKCHGADGKGETKMGKKLKARDFTDVKVQAEMKDDEIFKAIKEGVKEKGGDAVVMKPAEDLKDDEIKALVKYVRDFKK